MFLGLSKEDIHEAFIDAVGITLVIGILAAGVFLLK